MELPESASFSFGFEESENITFSDWPFDVPDDGPRGFIDEFNSDLGTLSLGTGPSDHFGDFSEARSLTFVHFRKVLRSNLKKKQNFL